MSELNCIWAVILTGEPPKIILSPAGPMASLHTASPSEI